MSNEQLEMLAAEAGLSVDWKDANARPQRVGPEALRKVLDGLGYPAEDDDQIRQSLERLQDQSLSTTPPPLLTVDHGSNLDLSTWFKPGTPFVLELEDGSRIDSRLTAQAELPGLSDVGYQQLAIDGQHLTIAVAPKTCFSLAMASEVSVPRTWGQQEHAGQLQGQLGQQR